MLGYQQFCYDILMLIRLGPGFDGMIKIPPGQ